jgi:hypothetical protein
VCGCLTHTQGGVVPKEAENDVAQPDPCAEYRQPPQRLSCRKLNHMIQCNSTTEFLFLRSISTTSCEETRKQACSRKHRQCATVAVVFSARRSRNAADPFHSPHQERQLRGTLIRAGLRWCGHGLRTVLKACSLPRRGDHGDHGYRGLPARS